MCSLFTIMYYSRCCISSALPLSILLTSPFAVAVLYSLVSGICLFCCPVLTLASCPLTVLYVFPEPSGGVLRYTERGENSYSFKKSIAHLRAIFKKEITVLLVLVPGILSYFSSFRTLCSPNGA